MPPELAMVPPASASFAAAPPHDEAAEQALLAAILTEPARLDHLAGLVRPEDFYVGKHRRLFAHMLDQHERTGVVDLVTIRAAADLGGVEEFGGTAYLASLVAANVNPANAKGYADVVLARARQRSLLTAAHEIQKAAHEHQDPRAILELARGLLADAERSQGRAPATVASLLEEAFAEITSSVSHQGISTGFVAIDGLIGGLEPGQMVVLGGRPSMGKSALGLNMGLRIASQGVSVGYLSFEMTRKQLMRRALAHHSGVSTSRLKGGYFLTDQEQDRLNAASAILKDSPLVIDDTEGCSPEVMRARARVLVERHDAKVLVVDHLHLMRPPERDRTVRSSTDAMTLISHAVKATAVELGVPVLALCQLNREAAKQARPTSKRRKHDDDGPEIAKPMLTDLRDSGALEQDADVVMLLHRNGYYTKDPLDVTAEVIVAKNRDGETGTAKLSWIAGSQRFEDVDPGFTRRSA